MAHGVVIQNRQPGERVKTAQENEVNSVKSSRAYACEVTTDRWTLTTATSSRLPRHSSAECRSAPAKARRVRSAPPTQDTLPAKTTPLSTPERSLPAAARSRPVAPPAELLSGTPAAPSTEAALTSEALLNNSKNV